MLIGIDASRAARPERTGTENYSLYLIRALLDQDDENHYHLYFNSLPSGAKTLPQLFGQSRNYTPRVMRFPRLWTHFRLSWEMATRPPDVLFVPAHVIPLIHPRRSVVTVHDLGYLHYPQAHTAGQRLYLDLSTRYNVTAAAHVIADSQHTKDDIIAQYGAPPQKITVVYPGRDEMLHPVNAPDILTRYGIDREYILYVGTLHSRKNLARLIEAYAQTAADVQLVLAGKKGWLYDEIFRRVADLDLTDRVIFTGYVPNTDLPALLTGARALVLPSLYEGFGFTLLEAMTCGTPVICSNVSSLPEVAGDAAILVNPHNTTEIATALERVLRDENLRAKLRERGFAQIRRFSWEKCAAQTRQILTSIS